MLTPDTKDTTYATGAVGTAANRIAKGIITWGDRHTSCSLHLPSLLALSCAHSLGFTNTPSPGPMLGTDDTSEYISALLAPRRLRLQGHRPPAQALLPASLTQIPKADILFPNRCRNHSHSGVLSIAETCEQKKLSQPAGCAASTSAQVLKALLGGTPHHNLASWLEPVVLNFITLAPIPPSAGMQVTETTAKSRMLTTRTLATCVMSRTTRPQLRLPSDLGSATPDPLTRMVSTRLWTWSCSREACVQNKTR